MGGAVRIAQAKPHAGGNSRPTEGDAEGRVLATGILTLNRPQTGAFTTFDAQDYAVIDFVLIANQWAALVQLGRTLHIVFGNGAVIELLNFFSYSSDTESSSDSDDTTGIAPDEPVRPLVRMSATELLSPEEFAHEYWITKSSGSLLIAMRSGGLQGIQVPGVEIGFPPQDLPLLPVLPDLFPPDLPLLPQLPLPEPPPPPPPVVSNVSPVITSADARGRTTEDLLPPRASGAIDFIDANPGDTHAVSIVPGAPNYLGTFAAKLSNDSTGGGTGRIAWTFLATNAVLQFLAAGQQLTQTYVVTIADGHGGFASQLVTVIVTGINDPAVITGVTGGAVVEAGGMANGTPGTATATGDLNSTDVDNPPDSWNAVSAPAASANGFGTFTLTAAGCGATR